MKVLFRYLARRTVADLVGLAIVVGCCFFVFLQLHPELVLAGTTPTGGDLGAHVWGPAYMRDHLLPDLRLTGWSPDWYAGFPAMFFYFPLPYLLIVILDFILPYNIAFKLVVVGGPVLMPACAYMFGRLVRLPRPVPEAFAISVLGFLFDTGGGGFENRIYGGNIAATMAGEFAFAVSLCFALLFLGTFARSLRTGRNSGWAALLFAATLLSHVIPTFFAVAGAIILVGLHLGRSSIKLGAAVATVGGCLTAIWFVPFALRLPLTNDMGWEKNLAYLDGLVPPDMIPVVVLAVVGTVMAIFRGHRGALLLAAVAVVFALAFRLLPPGRLWNNRLLPFWYLSIWMLTAYCLAEGVRTGVRRLRREGWVDATTGRQILVGAPVGALALALIVLMANLRVLPAAFDPVLPKGMKCERVQNQPPNCEGANFVSGWAKWNFEGYERKQVRDGNGKVLRDSYADFRDMIDTMGEVGRQYGCGRAMWEYEEDLNRYGTPMAPMLLPYYTDGCIGSMEGLYFESTPSVAFHFLNQAELSARPSSSMRNLPYGSLAENFDRGIRHLQMSGVRYYMATSPDAQARSADHPDLIYRASTKSYPVDIGGTIQDRSWDVYEVAGSPLVRPLTRMPVVDGGLDSKEEWLEAGVRWYNDEGAWATPVVDDGPPEWARVEVRIPPEEPGHQTSSGLTRRWGDEVELASGPTSRLPRVNVTNIRATDDTVSFNVDRVGVPVLVSTSYFPNWKASGAEGPYRATPNFMVVVPTSKSVELNFGRTGIDYLGILMTLAGVVGAVFLFRRGDDLFESEELRGRPKLLRAWSGAARDVTFAPGLVEPRPGRTKPTKSST